MAFAASVFAQAKPFSLPGTGQPPVSPTPPTAATLAAPAASAEKGTLDSFFNGKLPDAIAQGKFSLNARLRYEFAEDDRFAKDSNAATLRTRFGFTTAPLHGFTAMLEGENIAVLGPEHNFNAAGSNGQGARPPVADPPATELNQAWLAYNYDDQVGAKLGRQRIALDNHRFIGDVGWRQNMQTFDAVSATFTPIQEVSLYYGYLWEVNRVFGDVSGLPVANRDFESDSHLFNVSYAPFDYGRFVGYAYLLDLDLGAGATRYDNSCATYGGYFAGSAPVTDKFSLGYRAEVAGQTDYADSALDYDALYYNLELSGNVKPFAFGVGYEVLGSGRNDHAPGRIGFQTPLATLHAFNGWADMFLATPNAGLHDLYAFAQITLPWQMPLRFVYHKLDADHGGADFGHEYDVVLSKQLGKHWSAMLKYSYYHGQDAAPPAIAAANVNAHKLWAQIEFNY